MEKLAASMFADPANRVLPMDTPEHLLQSYETFNATKDKVMYATPLADIQLALDKAAAWYGVEPPMEKEATVEERPCFEFTTSEKAIKLTEPVNAEEFSKLASYIIDKRASTLRRELAPAAEWLLNVSDNLPDVDQNSPEMRKLARIAGIGVGDRQEIEDALVKRASGKDMKNDAKTFWNIYNMLHECSDDEFYKKANDVCDLIDDLDRYYGNNDRYGNGLQPPEDVVFRMGPSDLLKQASDMLKIASIDTIISKEALLERKEAATRFLTEKYGMSVKDDEDLFSKVASLDYVGAEGLLQEID